MLTLLRNLLTSVFGFMLIFAIALLALIQNMIMPYRVGPEWEDYDYYAVDPTFELTRDDDAYQASLYDVNSLRKKCFYGTNQHLSGRVTAVVIYMEDFESDWTNEQIDEFTEKDVEPALDFLEKQAEKYGVELDFETKILRNGFYDDEVIIDIDESGYTQP